MCLYGGDFMSNCHTLEVEFAIFPPNIDPNPKKNTSPSSRVVVSSNLRGGSARNTGYTPEKKKKKLTRPDIYLGGRFKYFVCSPQPGEMIQFDEHIFQMGWFNHQLDSVCMFVQTISILVMADLRREELLSCHILS